MLIEHTLMTDICIYNIFVCMHTLDLWLYSLSLSLSHFFSCLCMNEHIALTSKPLPSWHQALPGSSPVISQTRHRLQKGVAAERLGTRMKHMVIVYGIEYISKIARYIYIYICNCLEYIVLWLYCLGYVYVVV